jgi:hypothetical protein
MGVISDGEIYERTVNELPFTEGEQEARFSYWRVRSVKERLQAAHELMRGHYAKLGIDVDTLRMDKTVVRIAARDNRAETENTLSLGKE